MDGGEKHETFWRGIDCFNRRQFFTCHELLEGIWLAEQAEEKPYYQGLIQVAAAFHHYQNGNIHGTQLLLRAGADKLRSYPPDHHGIDVAGLLRQLEVWFDRLERGQALAGLSLPTIEPAPRQGTS